MGQVSEEGTEILRVLCGSRAYGLESDDSDFDYHGVYVVQTKRFLEIGPRVKETSWIEGEDQDNTAWELKHFLELSMHCNPTVLETFVAPVEEATEEGESLRALFPYMLAKKRIYDAFRGYASNQRKKMFEPAGGVRAPERITKAAIAYLRSLYQGKCLLEEGTYDPRINDADLRNFLLDLKKAVEPDLAAVVGRAMQLEKEITAAFVASKIQEQPDTERVNKFLMDTRKRHWNWIVE